mgnify:CR=1 FL=1
MSDIVIKYAIIKKKRPEEVIPCQTSSHMPFLRRKYQKNEKDEKIKALMERAEHLYVIGANGPDFLFSRMSSRGRRISHIS